MSPQRATMTLRFRGYLLRTGPGLIAVVNPENSRLHSHYQSYYLFLIISNLHYFVLNPTSSFLFCYESKD